MKTSRIGKSEVHAFHSLTRKYLSPNASRKKKNSSRKHKTRHALKQPRFSPRMRRNSLTVSSRSLSHDLPNGTLPHDNSVQAYSTPIPHERMRRREHKILLWLERLSYPNRIFISKIEIIWNRIARSMFLRIRLLSEITFIKSSSNFYKSLCLRHSIKI